MAALRKLWDAMWYTSSLAPSTFILNLTNQGAIMPEDQIMTYFKYDHLPEKLQEVSKPFCETAEWIHKNIPSSAERSVSLRKLLEAKDAGVRAAL